MGFGDAIRICLTKYVDFSGRARRAEYWWFALFMFLVAIVSAILDMLIMPAHPAGIGPIRALTSLGLLLPSLAVFVRRLHDLDRSGWWALALYAAAVILAFCAAAATAMGQFGITIVLALVLIAISIWMLVWMMTKGTPGPNRFGLDPLAGTETPSASPAAVL